MDDYLLCSRSQQIAKMLFHCITRSQLKNKGFGDWIPRVLIANKQGKTPFPGKFECCLCKECELQDPYVTISLPLQLFQANVYIKAH